MNCWWYTRIFLLCVSFSGMVVVAFAPIPCSAGLKPSIEQILGRERTVGLPILHLYDVTTTMDDDEDGDDDYDEDGDDDEDDDDDEDPYISLASSEFQDDNSASSSALAMINDDLSVTRTDWGGAIGKLRQRVEDAETGKSRDPSHVLFRVMSSETPNQVIGKFIQSANPETVQAMSGAVGSLLGGLSTPGAGIETVVKASGEKIGSLCFQLQMTGYMFRNAEYVLALKDVLDLKGKASLKDYKAAFDRLDEDNSGFIEADEVRSLFDDVYKGKAPAFEAKAFLEFFDQNDDGRISWEEFESGLGVAFAAQMEKGNSASRLLQRHDDDFEDDDDEEDEEINTNVSGTIDVELEDGMVVEVDAKEYMEALKLEAQVLKEELRRAKGGNQIPDSLGGLIQSQGNSMGLAQYIASREGDVASLTEGISPEVVETMKKLVEFVLEGGDSGKGKQELSPREKAEMQMEIPGAALQQLSLWQLVLGYRLREEEAKGGYKKLLSD
eukprot:scaffold24613_cov176-Cylindrotheca_fusiformis.AAC.8